MRTRKNLVLVLAATAACSALMVPAGAFASQHSGGRDDVVLVGQTDATHPGDDRSGSASTGSDDRAGHDSADDRGTDSTADDRGTDAGSSTSTDDDAADDSATGSDDSADDAATGTAVAAADHVKARLVAFDTMGVTWRAGRVGAAAARFVVRLVPASGSTLTATVDGSARSAKVGGLAASTRYRVSVTAVAADGTGDAVQAPARVATSSPESVAKATRRDADRAAKDVERAQKVAAKAQRRLERAGADDRAAAKKAAKQARHEARDAKTEAKHAEKEASRAERRAKAHREDD